MTFPWRGDSWRTLDDHVSSCTKGRVQAAVRFHKYCPSTHLWLLLLVLCAQVKFIDVFLFLNLSVDCCIIFPIFHLFSIFSPILIRLALFRVSFLFSSFITHAVVIPWGRKTWLIYSPSVLHKGPEQVSDVYLLDGFNSSYFTVNWKHSVSLNMQLDVMRL